MQLCDQRRYGPRREVGPRSRGRDESAEIYDISLSFRSATCFLTTISPAPGMVLVCLDQWRANGQIVYEPLLWAIEVSSHCPVHDRPLVTFATTVREPKPTRRFLPAGILRALWRLVGRARYR